MGRESRQLGVGVDHASHQKQEDEKRKSALREREVRERHSADVVERLEALSHIKVDTLLENIRSGKVYYIHTEFGKFRITGIDSKRGVISIDKAPYPDVSIFAATKITKERAPKGLSPDPME